VDEGSPLYPLLILYMTTGKKQNAPSLPITLSSVSVVSEATACKHVRMGGAAA